MDNPDEAADILHERVPDLDRAFLRAVVRDLNSENLWGVDGGLNPKIAEDTIDINVKLGNLPTPAKVADVVDQRFVEAAMKKLGPYKK
jgi:ABC-type nitrate/sulfonate/bicarbonate transport system substrate-binding protein